VTRAALADRIWRALHHCPPESIQWAALGYRAGIEDSFLVGYDQGWQAAHNDMATAWHEQYLAIHGSVDEPSRAELQRRRQPDHQPCALRCGECSRCVHSRAWWWRGQRDFLGIDNEARTPQRGAG
jgi:hypothetical protein